MAGAKFAGSLMLAVLFSGCTTFDLRELRAVEPQGDAFQVALAKGYLVLSEKEAANYDWIDSQGFADKGLTAAYGHTPEPSNPFHWDIPAAMREQAEQRYRLLGDVLKNGAAMSDPVHAAEAQLSFDCWLEEAEEWQEEEITACSERFEKAIGALGGLAGRAPMPLMEGEPEALSPLSMDSATPPEIMSSAYIVFFTPGTSSLDAKGRKMVEEIATDLKRMGEVDVLIHGYAAGDVAASSEEELLLSRAEVLASALEVQGIPKRRITVISAGEDALAKENKSGRRVEIFIH